MDVSSQTYPIISRNPLAQAMYELMRENGESHSIAEMCSLRAPPRCLTDAVMFAETGTLEKQYRGYPQLLERLTEIAMRQGYKPNPNDFYDSSIAEFPGDRKAFISPTGGRGQIQKVCEERDIEHEGVVTVKRSYRPPKERVPLGKDIIQREVRNLVQRDPHAAKAPLKDLEQEIINKHAMK